MWLTANAALEKLARHQQCPMTVQGVFFRADQRDPVALDALQHAADSLGKDRLFRQAIVLDLAFPVAGRVVAPRPQFLAQEHVGDSGLGQGGFQGVARVLRNVTAVGLRANVADRP